MALEVGIVGLPNAGKTTLFRALTRAGPSVPGREYVGVAPIADARLEAVARVVGSRKVTPAAIRVVDVPGAGAQLLGNLRQVDAFLVVLDAWSGTRDGRDDLLTLELELLLADRDHVERRLERVRKEAKSGDPAPRAEAAELERVLAHLDAERPLSDYEGELPASLEPLTSRPEARGGARRAARGGGRGVPRARVGTRRGHAQPLRGARPRQLLHRGREGDPCMDAAPRTDGARRGGHDPHGPRPRLHPLRGDPLGRSRRVRLARGGREARAPAARGQGLRRRGRRRAERALHPAAGRGRVVGAATSAFGC